MGSQRGANGIRSTAKVVYCYTTLRGCKATFETRNLKSEPLTVNYQRIFKVIGNRFALFGYQLQEVDTAGLVAQVNLHV